MRSVIHLSKYYRNSLANEANCIKYMLYGTKVTQRMSVILARYQNVNDTPVHTQLLYLWYVLLFLYVCMSSGTVTMGKS